MKKMLPHVFSLALLWAPTHALQAQEMLTISPEDISRMGIIFSPTVRTDASAGARFPATVINSPEAVATLSATYSGRITQWHQIAGDSVEAGALLATLASQDILPVQTAWTEAVAALEIASFQLEKDQTLFNQGVIAQQRLTQTRALQRQAAFTESSARALLAQAGFTEARLNQLRERGTGLGQVFLLAPANAVLTQRLATTGEFVEAGMPLATLNSGSRWVSVHIPSRMAADVAIGQTLSVAGSGETLTLRQMDFVVDSSNQTVELMAEFDRDAAVMTGQILSVALPPLAQGVLIPDRAVVHSGADTTVFVRTASGVEARTLALRPIGANYLAVSGIREGEEIAIQGTAVLKGIQLGLGGE